MVFQCQHAHGAACVVHGLRYADRLHARRLSMAARATEGRRASETSTQCSNAMMAASPDWENREGQSTRQSGKATAMAQFG